MSEARPVPITAEQAKLLNAIIEFAADSEHFDELLEDADKDYDIDVGREQLHGLCRNFVTAFPELKRSKAAHGSIQYYAENGMEIYHAHDCKSPVGRPSDCECMN